VDVHLWGTLFGHVGVEGLLEATLACAIARLKDKLSGENVGKLCAITVPPAHNLQAACSFFGLGQSHSL
jgi:hypothetical protein